MSLVVPLRGNVDLAASVGRFNPAGGLEGGSYWNVGASKLIGSLAVDVRYYGSSYEQLSYFGDPTANRYVVSFSYEVRGKRPR